MFSLHGPLSAAQATFFLIRWLTLRELGLQLIWNGKTVNLFKLSAWPIGLTFSIVMNENVDWRMFHKADNSKRIRKMQNEEVCNLFLLLKSLLQTFLIFFFLYLCHLWPIRLFSQDILAFLLWETSGWVSMEEPRINKIPADAGAQWEGSPWPHKQRHTPLPTLSGPFEKDLRGPASPDEQNL